MDAASASSLTLRSTKRGGLQVLSALEETLFLFVVTKPSTFVGKEQRRVFCMDLAHKTL